MNRKNLDLLFQNYIDNLDYFLDQNRGNEIYKWLVIDHVQNNWDLNAADLSGMLKTVFSKTYNLINNRIVSPGNGLVLLAREEPGAVRKAFQDLLKETDDVDEKQEQALRFVDEMNALLEKHYPGKWKYAQDLRVAITYLALIQPHTNFLYKSNQAHDFARYMEFSADIGYGATFKLKYYYQMCEELIAAAQQCPPLMDKDADRGVDWKDESHHLLATDLIFTFGTYDWMKKGLYEPPRARQGSSAKAKDAAIRAETAARLQQDIDQLQDQIDAVEKEIAELPAVQLTGKAVRTKAFGTAVIDRQEGEYIYLIAQGKERGFVLPDCVTRGFILLDDPEAIERFRHESGLNDQIRGLSTQQRNVMLELNKYQ